MKSCRPYCVLSILRALLTTKPYCLTEQIGMLRIVNVISKGNLHVRSVGKETTNTHERFDQSQNTLVVSWLFGASQLHFNVIKRPRVSPLK